MARIATDKDSEARVENAIASNILAQRDGDQLLQALSILSGKCDAPLHDWFQDRKLKILSLAWDEVLSGRVQPTMQAVYEFLDGMPFAYAVDLITGKRQKPYERCTHDESSAAGIGGYAALSAIQEAGFTSSASLPAVCEQLRNIRHRSIAIEALREIATKVASSTITSGPSAELSAGIEVLSGIITSRREHTIGDALHRAQDRAEAEASRRESGKQVRLSWGVNRIDQACTIAPGGLYVLAARPGVGKTSLALQSAVESAANGGKVGIVSFEMSGEQLATIIAGRCFGISRTAIEKKASTITDDAWQGMRTLADKWRQDRRIIILDSATTGQRMTVDTIAAWARINAKVGGMSYLIIDYCQLISSADPRALEYQTISNTTRALKTLAQSLQIPILLLSQMSREQDKVSQTNNTPRPPRLSDLRGSGSLEQDADAVAFLHDPSDRSQNPRTVMFMLEKNRAGPPSQVSLTFDGRWQIFGAPDLEGEPSAKDMITDRANRAQAKPTDEENLFNV